MPLFCVRSTQVTSVQPARHAGVAYGFRPAERGTPLRPAQSHKPPTLDGNHPTNPLVTSPFRPSRHRQCFRDLVPCNLIPTKLLKVFNRLSSRRWVRLAACFRRACSDCSRSASYVRIRRTGNIVMSTSQNPTDLTKQFLASLLSECGSHFHARSSKLYS